MTYVTHTQNTSLSARAFASGVLLLSVLLIKNNENHIVDNALEAGEEGQHLTDEPLIKDKHTHKPRDELRENADIKCCGAGL